MNSNWIKLNRKLLKTSYYKRDHEKVYFWIHLLMKANWEPTKEYLGGKPIICQPGQFTTGRRQLAEETGFTESKVERLLTFFEKFEQQIEQQKSSTNRLITVINWIEYQQTEQRNGQPSDNDRTTIEQRSDTLKEYKEYKEDQEKENARTREREIFEKRRQEIEEEERRLDDQKMQAFRDKLMAGEFD